MLGYAVLAGAMTMAAPAAAQAAPAQPQVEAGRTPMAPAQAGATQTMPQATQPATAPVETTTPAEQAVQAQPAPTPATPPATAEPTSIATATPDPAPSQPATQPSSGTAQVSGIIDSEFPRYDGNKDGQLTQAEFDSWMIKLKQASDPTMDAASPAMHKWLGAAFTQADKDRNNMISKAELVGFLEPSRS